MALWTPDAARYSCGARAGLSKAQEPQWGPLPGPEGVLGEPLFQPSQMAEPHPPGICLNEKATPESQKGYRRLNNTAQGSRGPTLGQVLARPWQPRVWRTQPPPSPSVEEGIPQSRHGSLQAAGFPKPRTQQSFRFNRPSIQLEFTEYLLLARSWILSRKGYISSGVVRELTDSWPSCVAGICGCGRPPGRCTAA